MTIRPAIVFTLSVISLLGGCRHREEPPPPPAPTLLLTSEPLHRLMGDEVAQFVSLYPNSPMIVRSIETREAIVHLLNDSVRNIAVDRTLNSEERSVAARAGIRLTENVFAEDALAIVVNAANPIERIGMASVRAIAGGSTTVWQAVPESRWAERIDLVLTGRNSGIPELLQNRFLKFSRAIQPTVQVKTQAEALARVAATPGAVTFVSALMQKELPKGLRVLAVESRPAKDSILFVRPTQMDIYQSLYPFHYSLYLYTAESDAAAGTGFITFVVKTVAGQKIVQNAGLAPVNVPNRVIQLTSE